jgi:folate-binding protein YgfZ
MSIDDSIVRLAGLCSQKGRLLASAWLWRESNGIRLWLSVDILESVKKHLSKFIFRSKVKFEDIATQWISIGFVGEDETTSAQLSTIFTTLPKAERQKVTTDKGTLVRLSDITIEGGEFSRTLSRYIWVMTRHIFEQHSDALHTQFTQTPQEDWDRWIIMAGEPYITAATQDQYVPQMLNFELIDGVSFNKGCYPGQEVVARLHYRGVVRRRTLRAHAKGLLSIGMEIFHSDRADEPCGKVIVAASTPTNGTDCLVQLPLAAVEHGTFHVGSIEGEPLSLLSLPYSFPPARI